MANELTRKQRAILHYMSRHMELYGARPGLRLLGQVFGVRHSTIHMHIERLRAKGVAI